MRTISALLFTLLMLLSAPATLRAESKTAGTRCETLPAELWQKAQWISVVNAPVVRGTVNDGARAADGASWFVAKFKNKQKVRSAKWMVTSLGVFDIYVNGKLIGNEILRPGFTHPRKTRRSFTYDVTKEMNTKRNAENTLAAEVTPGWWGDKIVTPGGNNGMVGRKCAFRAVLLVEYANGESETFATNTSDWLAGIAGPVRHAAIFDGEDYDARLPQGYAKGWVLGRPEVNTEFQGEVLPNDGAEIYYRTDLTLRPKEIYVWKDVEGQTAEAYGKVKVLRRYTDGQTIDLHAGEKLVVDFGQNASAVPEFTFQAAGGTTLTCLPGELLNDSLGLKSRGMDGPEGSVHRLNLRIPQTGMRLNYTFGNKGRTVTWKPRKTFFGYRYVSITATADVKISRIGSVPVSSISKTLETGTITTGNELVNRLISNTYWGQLSNYLSVPTDCPQRNERLGWMADTQVFTETGTFFANTDAFFHKWLRDVRDTQNPKGAYPGVAPWAQYGAMDGDMMRLGWTDAGIIVPWTVWKQFGDKTILNEHWESMERFMNHVDETNYDHNALKGENSNYQWADWLSYEPLESCSGRAFGKNGPKPEAVDYWNYLCASYWVIDAQMMADMAAATGRDAAKYKAMAERARQYIREKFVNSDGTFKNEILNTMQTPALFALKNHIFEGTARENLISRLRQNFADHGNCLQTGFLGTSILMPVLSDNGMDDLAYELLLQRKNPSWLYSVDNGATTIWERWNSYTLDKGMGPRGMNSFNHYAYGAVCQWLWEYAAGINTDVSEPGFRHIILRPRPSKRLGSIKAEYQSAAGLIKSEWRYEDGEWIWNFTIPEGTKATVYVPGKAEGQSYQPGSHTVKVPIE